MIEILEAQLADIPTIRDVAHRTWPETFGNILSPAQISYMLDMMYSEASLTKQMQSGQHFILALENNEPVGYASFEHNYKEEPKTKIHKIYVLPGNQGKGIGRILIESIASSALSQKQHTLSLNVNRYNKALDFYQHIGFVVKGQEDIDIGNGFLMEDFVLEKSF